MSGIFSVNLDDLTNLKTFLDHLDTESDNLQSNLKALRTAVDNSYNGPNKPSLDSDLDDLYNHLLQIDTSADKVRYALGQLIADIQAAEGLHL